jgi:hypothetical protein
MSAGKSDSLKNGPLEVPPRMKRQGIGVCMGSIFRHLEGFSEVQPELADMLKLNIR